MKIVSIWSVAMIGLSVSFLKSIGKHPGCNDLKPSPPPAPDYTGAARATAAGNLEAAKYTAEANRINQYTPYGSLTFSKNPTTTFDQAGYDKAMADYNAQPKSTGLIGNVGVRNLGAPDRAAFTKTNDNWSQTTSLAPEQQKLLDQQNQTSLALGNTMNKGVGYVQNMLDTPFDTSRLPAMPTTADNAGRDAMTQALLDRQQPMFDRQKSQTEANLLARGFNPGGEAFNASADDLARQQNDARLAAIQAGGQEQSRMFGLGTQARQNALQEQSFLRNEPLNTLNAVRTGAQVTQPQFSGMPRQQGVVGADLLGAANATGQWNQGTYNADQANQAATKAGLFSLGAAAMMSDRRLKRNIKRIGTHALGIGLYTWEYLWGEKSSGVMADEVEKVRPEAVLLHPSGFKMVDYSMLGV